MMQLFWKAVFSLAALAIAVCGRAAEPENPFDAAVTADRPRVFIRAKDFDGITIEKLRERMKGPEFARRRYKLRRSPLGLALEWMLDGKKEDLDAAIRGLKEMDWRGGQMSEEGMDVVRIATLYDWVRDQLDEATRKQAIAKLEEAGDFCLDHVVNGRAPFFYSRTPSALASLCVAGIALKGDSPKADKYLKAFRQFGVDEYFKAYEWVQGAATGGRYTFYFTYVDLGHICAVWWSATGRNPADWIRKAQGGWLAAIPRFYLWYMRPGISFTDLNDSRMGLWNVKDQFSQGLDLATYLTRDPYGRALSLRWNQKCGVTLYHSDYVYNFIFWDPTVEPKPLTGLPRAELFGRDSCGYAFFRSDWPEEGKPDAATHVFFLAGDPMDVHGGFAAGQFQVFRHAPLAARSGFYGKYDAPDDLYHRHCISTNVVLFLDSKKPDDRGDQWGRDGTKIDHATWAEWLKIREDKKLDVARITGWKVEKDEARCRVDLTRANPGKCKAWTRELVWLGYKHLIVLDIVERASPDVKICWQLHSDAPPAFADRLVTIVNRAPKLPDDWFDKDYKQERLEGKLFCRTLLPADYRIVLNRGAKSGAETPAAEAFAPDGKTLGKDPGNNYHLKYGKNVLQLEPSGDNLRTVFLHVLSATDADVKEPPTASARTLKPGLIEVTVGELKTQLNVPE